MKENHPDRFHLWAAREFIAAAFSGWFGGDDLRPHAGTTAPAMGFQPARCRADGRRGGGVVVMGTGREAADSIVRGRVCVLIGTDGGLVTGAALLSLYTAPSFDLLPVLTVLPPNKNTPHNRAA